MFILKRILFFVVFIRVTYCLLISKPNVDLSITHNNFTVISMSAVDREWYWWKWLMKSYYEEYLTELSEGVDTKWNDTSVCQLRFNAIVQGGTKIEDYLDGGIGYINDLTNLPFIKRKHRHIRCFYSSSLHTWAHSDSFVRVAIYCPIMRTDLSITFALDETQERVNFCNQFRKDANQYEIRIFPSNTPPKEVFVFANRRKFSLPVWASNSVIHPARSIIPAVVYNKTYDDASRFRSLSHIFHVPNTKLHVMSQMNNEGGIENSGVVGSNGDHTPAVLICTVQTFKSPTSGPFLWLFTKYHLNLGLVVLIFDRFGQHYEYVKEFVESNKVPTNKLIYMSYTPLELLRPDVYNSGYQSNQGTDFKFYYARDQGFGNGKDHVVVNDVLEQDYDKQISFDIIRTEFDESYRVLFVDADELLAPIDLTTDAETRKADGLPELSGEEKQHYDEIWDNLTVSTLGKDLDEYLRSKQFTREVNPEVSISRYAVSAFTPSNQVHPKDVSIDGDMVDVVLNCTIAGYGHKSMEEMLSCWSATTKYQHHAKYVDMGATCPFHWSHKSCAKFQWDRKKKWITETTPTNIMKLGGNKNQCFSGHYFATTIDPKYALLHLSHTQYCGMFRFFKHLQPDVVDQYRVFPLVDVLKRSELLY